MNLYRYRAYLIKKQGLVWVDVTETSPNKGMSFSGFTLSKSARGAVEYVRPQQVGDMIEIDWDARHGDGNYFWVCLYKELKLFDDVDYGDDT